LCFLQAALETYLQTLINLPVKNKDEVIAFFTSDIVREAKKPVSQVGYKEGYLTKRGKNFGGWKSRFFVLQGPVLEYYESVSLQNPNTGIGLNLFRLKRGGTHLGSIMITGSQIGRQQTSGDKPVGDEEKEYRHAFLIVEAKKGPGGNHPRHVLCAESDADRDSWVEILVRYVMGSYNDDPIPALGLSNATSEQAGPSAPRSSTSSVTTYDNSNPFNNRRHPARPSRDEVLKGSSLQTGSVASLSDDIGESSPVKSIDPAPIDRQGPGLSDAHVARKILERGQQPSNSLDAAQLSSSLPNSSPLDSSILGVAQRANSELGHYPDMRHRDLSPERHRRRDHHGDSKPSQPTSNAAPSSTNSSANLEPRAGSPEKLDANGKAKISGPIGGAPIPAGYKFGGKDAALDPSAAAAANERRDKTKSRSFWGFGRPNGGKRSFIL
jgi:RalA-binding protein 1